MGDIKKCVCGRNAEGSFRIEKSMFCYNCATNIGNGVVIFSKLLGYIPSTELIMMGLNEMKKAKEVERGGH